MASINDLFGSINLGFGSSGGLVDLLLSFTIGIAALLLCGGLVYWIVWKRKNWNIKVEFRLPRDISEVIDEEGNFSVKGTIQKEWGKGYYNGKRGVVFIKRKGKKAVEMKPFDVKRFLSGKGSILTVIQVGINDYRPVLEESYLEVEDLNTGDKAALIKAKIDTSESKGWKNVFERESKSTYTVLGWMHEHGQLIGFGFIVLMIIVGFAIVLGRIN